MEGRIIEVLLYLHCITAMNIVVPLTTELSLLQRRGGARKLINMVQWVLECIT